MKYLEKFIKIYDNSKVNFVGLTKNIIIICKVHREFQTWLELHLGRDSRDVYNKEIR